MGSRPKTVLFWPFLAFEGRLGGLCNSLTLSSLGVWLAFCRWCFVEVMNLNLGRVFEARLGYILNFKFIRDADVWLRFLVDA